MTKLGGSKSFASQEKQLTDRKFYKREC